jgi:hypothetical protein
VKKRSLVTLAVTALLLSSFASEAAAARRIGASVDEPSTFVRVAVLLVNFTNQPSEPWSKTDVDRLFFTGERSVASYYDELSEGRMSVSGEVFGYLKAGARSGYCEYVTWGRLARKSAAAKGIDLSQFTNVVYIFPFQPACKWNGFARPGPNNTPGRDSWVNGPLTPFVTTHELGHNFGLGHASSVSCNVDGVRVSMGGSCSTYDYGDPFDVMGYGGQRHMQAWHRYRLGFLPSTDVVTVTESGTYRISPAEFGGEHPRLLRIPRGDSFLYLEYRQPFGLFDDFGAGASVVNGASIRVAWEGYYRNTRLVDTTPETCTFLDSALAVGQTFRDPGNGIRVSTLDLGPNSLQVEVRLNDTGSVAAGEVDPPDESDIEPPGPVANIAVQQVTGRIVAVSWTKATDNERVARYEVYKDGLLAGTTCDLRFRNMAMSDGVPHQVGVRAVDASGNAGPIETITYTPTDFTSPVMYRRIFTSVSGSSVTISWRAARDNVGVSFYRVMKNGQLLANVDGSLRSYRDATAGTGTLRYSVTAFDAAGNASKPIRKRIDR